jgi:hypothetical protein
MAIVEPVRPLLTDPLSPCCRGTAFDWEKALYQTLYNTNDRKEGLMAFKEKRPAIYEGE